MFKNWSELGVFPSHVVLVILGSLKGMLALSIYFPIWESQAQLRLKHQPCKQFPKMVMVVQRVEFAMRPQCVEGLSINQTPFTLLAQRMWWIREKMGRSYIWMPVYRVWLYKVIFMQAYNVPWTYFLGVLPPFPPVPPCHHPPSSSTFSLPSLNPLLSISSPFPLYQLLLFSCHLFMCNFTLL